MPSFTTALPDLHVSGPLVEVMVQQPRLMLQALAAKGQSLPPQQVMTVTAMLDTGASGTVINPSVATTLGLSAVGAAQMSTPSTQQPVTVVQHNVDLVFPQGVTVSNVMVIQAPLAGQHIQCLIGRDVLRHGVLVYIGYANQFTLAF